MYRNFFLLGLIVILISGCARRYPLGLNKEEWNKLSVEKKTEYSLKQSKIDEKIREQNLKKWKLQKQYELEQQKAEKERLDRIYQNARYGDIINVNLYNGLYSSYKEFMSIQPTAFTIARGEVKQIKVITKNKRNYTYTQTFWVMFSQMGNQLLISPRRLTLNDTNDAMVILNNGKWHKEQKYHKSYTDGYDKLKDFTIGVRYADFTKRH